MTKIEKLRAEIQLILKKTREEKWNEGRQDCRTYRTENTDLFKKISEGIQEYDSHMQRLKSFWLEEVEKPSAGKWRKGGNVPQKQQVKKILGRVDEVLDEISNSIREMT